MEILFLRRLPARTLTDLRRVPDSTGASFLTSAAITLAPSRRAWLIVLFTRRFSSPWSLPIKSSSPLISPTVRLVFRANYGQQFFLVIDAVSSVDVKHTIIRLEEEPVTGF